MRAASAILGILLSTTLAIGAAWSRPAAAAEQGTVYLWVDKDGTPHYEDRPPEGSEAAKELSLRYKLTDGQAIASASKRKSEMDDAAQLREQQQASDKADEDADREQVINEREQGCNTAREKLTKYETAHKLYKPGPDGKRSYLSDEETDAARAEARRDVDEWCNE
jgi:hypothetical protein